MDGTQGTGATDVQIRLDSARELDDRLALIGWLRGERGLQGGVHVLPSEPAENELGAGFELLTVSLGSGGIATVLAGSLATWLQNRRTPTKIRISITRDDRTLELETGDAAEAEALIRRFLGEGTDGV
ncbi:effector-associated constant component EACC1 [Streptomyces sp. WAC 04229]|uniref:effector-associated constant component EACC1 n=1 Tax=Streptomyces sp. WAC 04229 TaxID=2203206 RepID=UPI003D71D304